MAMKKKGLGFKPDDGPNQREVEAYKDGRAGGSKPSTTVKPTDREWTQLNRGRKEFMRKKRLRPA